MHCSAYSCGKPTRPHIPAVDRATARGHNRWHRGTLRDRCGVLGDGSQTVPLIGCLACITCRRARFAKFRYDLLLNYMALHSGSGFCGTGPRPWTWRSACLSAAGQAVCASSQAGTSRRCGTRSRRGQDGTRRPSLVVELGTPVQNSGCRGLSWYVPGTRKPA
jgi:hypothetical protein